MDTLASYDELPYDSLPVPDTQPDVLRAIARLHGFEAPAPERARILELGCAQGGNLIPLAWRWPDAQCVGVELSRVQAEAGARFVERLGVSNVRILHGDLAALPPDLGEFDYIIAHGVYSWVPPAVQQALLEACRQHLSPQGVACISFNVAAGWAALLPLHQALVERTSASLPAPERYRQALGVLTELEREWHDPVLLKEIAFLKTAAPSYLFHEYLDAYNQPKDFNTFVSELDAHALRYVGEAGPRHAVVELENAWGLVPEGMTGRWLDAEAALDEAQATRFRRALVARDDAPCAQPPQPEALGELAFYADLASHDEIDLESACEQHFVNPAGLAFPVAQPAMKAALIALSTAYPNALAYPDLLAEARHLMSAFGVEAAFSEPEFREALFPLVMAHIVMPTAGQQHHAAEPGTHPRAHVLARLQAQSAGWAVTGARHVPIELDAPGRFLLAGLDGSRPADALAASLQAWADESHAASLPTDLADTIHRQLWLFARQGLLVE